MKTIKIQDRIIQDRSEMESILHAAKVGRLGICQNGLALIIPVNFAYEPGSIYVHGSSSGLRVEVILENPHVCFEVDEFLATDPASTPCEYDTAYRSVIAFGSARVLSTPDEKMPPLRLIVAKYAGEDVALGLTREMVQGYRSSRGRETAVVKVSVERMTGKRSVALP
jgi:nitroimidazol reductase NimA-like FMN-containing flavoprotein (pyridoxamine 5'-phosphate oxidase superfamily)